MFNKEDSTGSKSQDALIAGFMTTCSKGIAVLLGVDSMVVEACKEFIPRHEEKVDTALKVIDKYVSNEIESMQSEHLGRSRYWRGKWRMFFINTGMMKRPDQSRKFSLLDGSVKRGERKHDLENGTLITEVTYTIQSDSWEGWVDGEYVKRESNVRLRSVVLRTDAKRGSVRYVPYDDYSARLIPDALEAAKDAVAIGMTKIQVAFPLLTDGRTASTSKDPVIIGYVGDQMFVSAH